MNTHSSHRLTLGLVLGVLLSLAAAYYQQGNELAKLRRHHATAHRCEIELKTENALLRQRLDTESASSCHP
jgi:hypothetical protein